MNRRNFIKKGIGGVCAAHALRFVAGASDSGVSAAAHTAEKGFYRARPAKWFSKLGNSKIRCELCPVLCELEDGARGRCRVRVNRGGKCYTLAYGNPALLQDDPVERKPFFHVLPGVRALSMSTAGCCLRCKFCEVWDMALTGPEDVFAYDMPPEKVVAHAVASNVRAISYAFGEPVVFYEYMADTAELAGKAGLLNLLHTSGYIQPEPLKELTGKIDAANVDLKSFDPAFYRDVVGGRLEPVLESLRLIKKSGVHLEVTNMIIPSLNDDPGLIGGMCEWIKSNLGADVPLHFARFYPLYKLSSLPRTPVSTLDRAREIAVGKGLKFVYIAKVPGHDAENTFCPGCRKIVVKRVGFIVDGVNIEDGACEHCGRKIAGRWK